MKIHFKLPYYTIWGQRILVSGNIPELGNNDPAKALHLHFQNKEDWMGEIELKNSKVEKIEYKYILYTEQTGQFLEEWIENRTIQPETALDHLFCFDIWNSPSSLENTFLTSAFANVLLKDEHGNFSAKPQSKYTHHFRVKAPLLSSDQQLCIIGDCKAFGNWTTHSPMLMYKSESGFWEAFIDLSKVKSDVHYKYGVYHIADKKFLYFESGADRTAPTINSKNSICRVTDGFANIPSAKWRGTGVGVPVFSLRSQQSFGVGDFRDLMLFTDWAKKTGIKLIQVLPLNDTTGTHTEADVLPYAAISAFALNPLFLNLKAMGELPVSHPLNEEYLRLQPEYNAASLVQFLDVIDFKIRYSKALFEVVKDKFLKDKNFQKFFNENTYWLVPYSAYCVLRDINATCDYTKWNKYAHFDEQNIRSFVSPEGENFDAVALNYFIQYHLHIQLLAASEYAHNNGIVLKGDIPIGVNRNSVDTWSHPDLFNMDKNAGAPPDMFAVKGQNWELPTYNWDRIKQTDFDWWKRRFAQMSNYFDTFRIDHILGFFRIWQIPLNQTEGIMGHLFPSTPIHINEFSEKGIWFDYNRFCKPYITDSILTEFFGDDASWVKTNCLQVEDGWVLRLKPLYLSQQNIEKLYEEKKITERVKWGLFDLISNVLLFEVEGSEGKLYYPRYGMESIFSFKDLDEYTKNKFRELYVDYFYRRQDERWYQSGMEKLPQLKKATNMLICGEDLGMMTPCVTRSMKELGILSLEVQRAPKSDKIEFCHPADAPYLSVVTPSTHDMSTIRGWWEEDRGVTQRFYNSQLGHWGEAPYFCDWWICRDILLQHLYSPAMWAIFQIQDLLAISDKIRRENPHEERINVPSNSKFSWRYRMHLNLEDLLVNDEFNGELKNFIVQSGR